MRLSIAVLPSLSVMVLCIGLSQTTNSHVQLTNKIQESISIPVIDSGSQGADSFVDPHTNQIYSTNMKTQNGM
ncbi:MAG: hypothetical protein P0116_10775 [Candidatus Nitrosocosmicus sp.]|nr:hypothetical protein [Candidatus Nitrosocosmicus sp.]